MSSSNSADHVHHAFVKWAVEKQGVEIDGVEATRFPQRGYGIRATRDLRKGDRLIFMPRRSLITIHSTFVKKLKLPKECTVHGRLAAAFTLMASEADRYYRTWEQTWPSQEDILSLPLTWNESHVELLPQHCANMLEKQRNKISRDRDSLKDALPSDMLASQLYTYYWLVVNSRCFYWDYPTAASDRKLPKRRKKLPADECMALCPFADYFNHADHGCDFNFDASGSWITADRDYSADEELYLSYGAHSNDFLLIEYGFVLLPNKWDLVKLDEYILPKLTASQRQTLKDTVMLGDYTLDSTEICYRTQASLCGLVMTPAKWRNFLSGDYEGEAEQKALDRTLGKVLSEYIKFVKTMMKKVEALDEGQQKDVLAQRWSQIIQLLEAHVKRLAGPRKALSGGAIASNGQNVADK